MRRFKLRSRLLSIFSTLSVCLALILGVTADNIALTDTNKTNKTIGDPTIVSENTAMRGRYEKHFLKSDGTYTATTYAVPVHYKDESSGEWHEIDNTLVETTDDAGRIVYKNRDGLFDVTFAKNPGVDGNSLVTVENKGYSISWQLIGNTKKQKSTVSSFTIDDSANEEAVLTGASAKLIQADLPATNKLSMNAEKATGALLYPCLADDDADVRYTVTPLLVKEDFLLNEEPVHAVSYAAKLTLSDDLTPVVTDDGGVQISNDEGDIIFEIAAPYMTDAAGARSDDVTLTLRQTGNHWKLTVTPDLSWLQDDTRVYPVSVDPTVYAGNAASNTWDTYIYEGSTSSDGKQRQDLDRMYVGNLSSTKTKCRALIRFLAMPTINGSITSATLTLTTPPGTSTWQGIRLYRIKEGWDSLNVSWPGPQVEAINVACAINGKYVFGVTSDIQDMYTNSNTGFNNNYGFEVQYMNENVSDYNSICSSEYGVDSEMNLTKPCLTITYQQNSSSPGIVSGRQYFIRSKYSDKYMDVTNSGGSETPVIQHGFNGNANQRWQIVYEGNDLYSLAPAHDLSLRLDVPYSSSENGVNLQVFPSNNGSNQRWRIIANGDGSYRLMPQCAQNENLVLDIEGPSMDNGAPLQLLTWKSGYSQMMWYLEQIKSVNIRHFYDDGYASRYPGIGAASPDSKIAEYQQIVSNYFLNVFHVDLRFSVEQQRSEVDSCSHGGSNINTYCQRILNGMCDYNAGRYHCTNALYHLWTLPTGVDTVPGPNGRIIKWTGHKLCGDCLNNSHTSKIQSLCGGTRIAIQWGDHLTSEDRDIISIGSIAHELGHSFGCIGDGSLTCSNTMCIMRYGVTDDIKFDNLASYNLEAYCGFCRSKIKNYIQTQL